MFDPLVVNQHCPKVHIIEYDFFFIIPSFAC